MNIAYVRVSTAEQNEARQTEALAQFHIEKWFVEKASGKNTDRPVFQEMMNFAREGDVLYIHDFSRLARSTRDLLETVEMLQEKGVILKSNKENLDTSTPTGKLMLTMIGAINEFERQNLLDRQAEGIAIAKRAGKYKGGQRKRIDMPKFDACYQDYLARKINKGEFAKEMGVSRPTLDKLLKEKTKME